MLKKEHMKCRSCQTPVSRTFVDLGLSPLANSFVKPEHLNSAETFYPLHAKVCESCFLVQLDEFEKAENIFSDYLYFSSFSKSWLEHCQRHASEMTASLNLTEKSMVVEVASNDGYLLQYFKERRVPVLGIEPAANVAEVAVRNGIPTHVDFFGRKCAENLLAKGQKKADLMVANNVLAHVPDINDFIAGFKVLLANDGVATFEFPHLLNLVQKIQFDTIYHEHFSYISLLSATVAFKRHDLEIFDVMEIPTHGGSLRLFVQHAGAKNKPSNRLMALEKKETTSGMKSVGFYESFESKVNEVKRDLVRFAMNEKAKGAKIVGYGAAAKGNTLLNYCGIRCDILDYVVDANTHKQGTYLPGTRIPVLSPQKIYETKPDFVLILPWNLRDEISTSLKEIRAWNGKFITAIPELAVF